MLLSSVQTVSLLPNPGRHKPFLMDRKFGLPKTSIGIRESYDRQHCTETLHVLSTVCSKTKPEKKISTSPSKLGECVCLHACCRESPILSYPQPLRQHSQSCENWAFLRQYHLKSVKDTLDLIHYLRKSITPVGPWLESYDYDHQVYSKYSRRWEWFPHSSPAPLALNQHYKKIKVLYDELWEGKSHDIVALIWCTNWDHLATDCTYNK